MKRPNLYHGAGLHDIGAVRCRHGLRPGDARQPGGDRGHRHPRQSEGGHRHQAGRGQHRGRHRQRRSRKRCRTRTSRSPCSACPALPSIATAASAMASPFAALGRSSIPSRSTGASSPRWERAANSTSAFCRRSSFPAPRCTRARRPTSTAPASAPRSTSRRCGRWTRKRVFAVALRLTPTTRSLQTRRPHRRPGISPGRTMLAGLAFRASSPMTRRTSAPTTSSLARALLRAASTTGTTALSPTTARETCASARLDPTTQVCTPRIADSVKLFRGVDMYHNFANQVEISERERIGGNLTVQYAVSDNLRLTLDALVSHEDHHFHNSSAVTDFSGGTLTNQVVVGGTDTTETVAGHVAHRPRWRYGDGGNVPRRNRRRDRRGSPANISREYLRVAGGLEKRTFGCQLRRVDEQSGVRVIRTASSRRSA